MRKEFAAKIASIVTALLAVSFLAVISADLHAGPAQEAPAANVVTDTVRFDSGSSTLDAFVAKPSGGGRLPAVLVIHDAQGLNDSIREIARQFAGAGFVALAPDFTSRLGGKRAPEQMAEAVGQLSPNTSVSDARAAFAYLQKDPAVDATKISTVGYGWGGWRSFMLAASVPGLYRAVIYCGATPSESFDAIHAPVLAHYAQFDFRTTGNALLMEKNMAEAGRKFTYFVYPQVNRGFYAAGPQFNTEAAKQAWSRTLDFLK